MTTIAFRDGTLAADSQATNGHLKGSTRVKIARNERGDLAGASGDCGFTAKFLRWFEGGEKSDPPECHTDDSGPDVGVIYRVSGEIEMFEPSGSFVIHAEYHAIGSGCHLALGAMAAGFSAEAAVEVAAKHDCYTGGAILTMKHSE